MHAIGSSAISLLKNIPVLGPFARRLKRRIIGEPQTRASEFQFQRLTAADEEDLVRRQIGNLLNYTKTSGASYSAHRYPAGYHTIEINGRILQGQRNPSKRLDLVPVAFEGKTVLDIGCNQGGMLFQLDRVLKAGIGIDFDSRMINVANRIKVARESHNLAFYVFDLEKEPLELVKDFIPGEKVDIAFLLAVCMWLSNWKQVIDFTASISSSLLFETNGTDEQQSLQERYLRSRYEHSTLLSETSDDDERQKKRRLLYFSEPKISSQIG
jgi:SAM-dependent methyltransferase